MKKQEGGEKMATKILKEWIYVFKFLIGVYGVFLISFYFFENLIFVAICWVSGMYLLYNVGYFKKPNLKNN